MLARANRITKADGFRTTVRRGAKTVGRYTVSYVHMIDGQEEAKFGFIVSKHVGNAVRRNRVRRRLKAAGYATISRGARGMNVVVRALPAAVEATWDELCTEVERAVNRQRSR